MPPSAPWHLLTYFNLVSELFDKSEKLKPIISLTDLHLKGPKTCKDGPLFTTLKLYWNTGEMQLGPNDQSNCPKDINSCAIKCTKIKTKEKHRLFFICHPG